MHPSELEKRLSELCDRYREIFKLVGLGYSSRYVASKVGIQRTSVNIAIHRICDKIGINRHDRDKNTRVALALAYRDWCHWKAYKIKPISSEQDSFVAWLKSEGSKSLQSICDYLNEAKYEGSDCWDLSSSWQLVKLLKSKGLIEYARSGQCEARQEVFDSGGHNIPERNFESSGVHPRSAGGA